MKVIIIAAIFFFLTLLYLNESNKSKSNKEIIKKLQLNSDIKDEEFLKIDKYYINLERSKDRNKKILDQFKKYKVKNYNRVEAYDIEKMNEYNYINEYGFINSSRIEMIVTMSHIKAINNAYLDNREIAMIMEDDINLCTVSYWDIKLKDIIKDIPEDCDILLLANNCFEEGKIIIKKAKESYNIATGVCYLVTKKGMEKLNKNFIRDDKIIFLKSQNLKDEQSLVFDRGFLNFFNLYYTSRSLFITEDFNQKSLIQNNLKFENSISSKVLKYYKKFI